MTKNEAQSQQVNPRDLLRQWANDADEWVRYIVRCVLRSGGPLSSDEQNEAYLLFRQEKDLDPREFPKEEQLVVFDCDDEEVESLTLTSLSNVIGVNALVEGGTIEPHDGLTILFGENGTGKTGYSRVFKALAASRTADEILGNIEATSPQPPSALVGYTLGTESRTYHWTGEHGVAPFTRMSIFDNAAVSVHIDDELDYVYTPAALALFNHVSAGIKLVQQKINQATQSLPLVPNELLSRFPSTSTLYPLIKTLGASTDLEELESYANSDPDVDTRIIDLRREVAELETDTISTQIKLQRRVERVLAEASNAAAGIAGFDVKAYDRERNMLHEFQEDHRNFRTSLFKAADLPTEPDDTWSKFIESGEAYQAHLIEVGAHDTDRCLYCRQPLNEAARSLIGRYSEYLRDKISANIKESEARLQVLTKPVISIQVSDLTAYVDEYRDTDDKPRFYVELERTLSSVAQLTDQLRAASAVNPLLTENAAKDGTTLSSSRADIKVTLEELTAKVSKRDEILSKKMKELVELEAAAELTKSWTLIESYVDNAKQVARLEKLGEPIPTLLRNLTKLAKAASDEMINESFDTLFYEECKALRAPALPVKFSGREGRAQRCKTLSGNYKPSKVLSEGEQKVLALADFLAEARLAGVAAPVIFDDPVSSLDHRRIKEVAQRIASLAETIQVIVFTHDIFFTTTLLSHMEATKRCSYFQISDEGGKGKVIRATGPRWDSLSNIKRKINETIQAAKLQTGDQQAALVRTGYDWLRAWCEVFTETELLQGVTQRYQPNVRMTNLPKIKSEALPAAIDTVQRIFEEACRYIDGHSQPLPSLGVSPTLAGLESHWDKLTEARSLYIQADR